jgi:ribokinase
LISLARTVVIGAINWDINLFIKKFPREGEEVVVKRILRVPGGKAGNVAVATARLLGSNQSAIFGGLGQDSVATDQIKIFEKEGVIVSGLKFTDQTESGQAYIIVDELGENIIHTHQGANSAFTPDDLDDPTRKQLVSDSSVVTIMDPPFDTAIKLAIQSKRLRKTVVWDPGVKSELGLGKVSEILENVDYVMANESEILNLTGTQTYEKAASLMRKVNDRLKLVAKLGADGCILFGPDKCVTCKALNIEALGMKVVNTVGCGDAFLGAFIAALSEGLSDNEALKWGNCAGGLKATRSETRGSPDRGTLIRHLASLMRS